MEGMIAGVATLPSPWPPPRTVVLFDKKDGGNRVTLSANSNGSFMASFDQDGRTTETRIFGPLEIVGAAKVIVVLTRSQREIRFHVNGVEIPPEAPGAQPVRLPHQVDNHISGGLVLPSLDCAAGESDDERFFLATLADIDHKVVAGDRYSLIRAGGLLRQLLLDGLVHAVNHKHRVCIQFTTVDFTRRPPVEIGIATHWEALDPSPFRGAPTINCSLDRFLAAPCLFRHGVNANVKDLIRACANSKGGIHLGNARRAEEQIVLEWDEVFSMLGEEPSLQALAGVCRVVLVGMRDLAKSITTDGRETRVST